MVLFPYLSSNGSGGPCPGYACLFDTGNCYVYLQVTFSGCGPNISNTGTLIVMKQLKPILELMQMTY